MKSLCNDSMTNIRSAQSTSSCVNGFPEGSGAIPADSDSQTPFQPWKDFSAVGLRWRFAVQTKSTFGMANP